MVSEQGFVYSNVTTTKMKRQKNTSNILWELKTGGRSESNSHARYSRGILMLHIPTNNCATHFRNSSQGTTVSKTIRPGRPLFTVVCK